MNITRTVIIMLALCLGVLNTAFAEGPSTTKTAAVKAVTMVNINTANAESLASVLTGVGVTKANAIIAYRDLHGQFKSADELTAVKGIGSATVEKNRNRIKF